MKDSAQLCSPLLAPMLGTCGLKNCWAGKMAQ